MNLQSHRTLHVRCITSVIIALLFAGCGSKDAAESNGLVPDEVAPEFSIVCTVGMVADIVKQVTGDRAEVSNIIGEGVDPHLYLPTRGDIARLQKADIVFYSGLRLEGKMGDALERVAESGKHVFAVTELIDESSLLAPPGFDGHFDPHVWMDVDGWMLAVEAVRDAMIKLDPDHQADYESRTSVYLLKLADLDEYARVSIGSIPERSRILVTAHDAFNYFGRAYDIEVRGIQGISTESEAGIRDINELVDLIVERDVRAVFVESSVAEKYVRALLESTASRGHALAIGGTLYSDAMGQPGSYEGTYIGMIDHNVTTITRALGGEAPARGMTGSLAPPRSGEHREGES